MWRVRSGLRAAEWSCWVIWGATETLQDQPESLPAHSVERFGQVDKGYVQLFVLLPTLLLKLPVDEDHVCGAPVFSKAALSFWQVVFRDGRNQPVQEYASQNFSCNGQ